MITNNSSVTLDTCHIIKDTTAPFILVPDENSNIFEALSECAKIVNLQSAIVSGIGSIKNIELGFYDHTELRLNKNVFHGIYEIASLSGSITWYEDAPFIHLHGAFSDASYQTVGGHMISAQAGSALEIYITPLTNRVNRVWDEHMQIKRIHCP